MEKTETIHAVEIIRSIRDAFYEQLKDRNPRERLDFYRDQGAKAHAALQELASSKSLADDDARL